MTRPTDAEIMADVLATVANRFMAEILRGAERLPDPPLDPMGPGSSLTDLTGAALALGCRVEIRLVPFGEV